MRASVVIASLNEGDLLTRTVTSCLETMDGLDCELLVVDDASNDGSADQLVQRFSQPRLLRHQDRRGVAATKDAGARQARGEILVFLDGHCNPAPGAIARLVAVVEQLGGGAIVTPRIPTLDTDAWRNKLDCAGHGYEMDLESMNSRWIGLEQLRLHDGTGPSPLYRSPAFIGCCVAMHRRVYDRLCGFDIGMRSWGIEDLDLGLKAWLMGHPILHDPVPVIGHRFRACFDTYAVPMAHVIANQLRMARKNFSESVWDDWVTRARGRFAPELWETSWNEFESARESVEHEREYLLSNRQHDELWYAREFGLGWPVQSAQFH